MSTNPNSNNKHLEQGKALARELFELRLSQLASAEAGHSPLRQKYALLTDEEFADVVSQVRQARLGRSIEMAAAVLPRDLVIILVTVLTWTLNDWRLSAVIGIAVLVFGMNLIGFLRGKAILQTAKFSPVLAGIALLLFAWYFYSHGYAWYLALAAFAALGLGSLLLAGLIRVFAVMMQNARLEAKARKDAEGGNHKA